MYCDVGQRSTATSKVATDGQGSIYNWSMGLRRNCTLHIIIVSVAIVRLQSNHDVVVVKLLGDLKFKSPQAFLNGHLKHLEG